MRSKYFLSHLILTPDWCLKKRIESWWEKFHCHTIPSYRSSKSPFGLWLGLRETPHVSHLSMEGQHCLLCNQHQATWGRCKQSTPQHHSKTGKPTHSSRRHPQQFLPKHCHSGANQIYMLSPLWKSSWKGAMYSKRTARWARTWSCSRSPNLVPNSIGSKSSPEDPKWSPPLTTDTVPGSIFPFTV